MRIVSWNYLLQFTSHCQDVHSRLLHLHTLQPAFLFQHVRIVMRMGMRMKWRFAGTCYPRLIDKITWYGSQASLNFLHNLIIPRLCYHSRKEYIDWGEYISHYAMSTPTRTCTGRGCRCICGEWELDWGLDRCGPRLDWTSATVLPCTPNAMVILVPCSSIKCTFLLIIVQYFHID